jgi:hypothetical protein
MTKTQIIVSTKSLHTRLKNNVSGLRDLVHAGYQQRHLKRLNRLHQRWESQLTDELSQPLLQALWTYRTEHWRVIEAKHGKVSHCFDAFGQVKPHYRERARCADEKDNRGEGEYHAIPWYHLSFWLGVVVVLVVGYWLVT